MQKGHKIAKIANEVNEQPPTYFDPNQQKYGKTNVVRFYTPFNPEF